jgi:hypothetical protein
VEGKGRKETSQSLAVHEYKHLYPSCFVMEDPPWSVICTFIHTNPSSSLDSSFYIPNSHPDGDGPVKVLTISFSDRVPFSVIESPLRVQVSVLIGMQFGSRERKREYARV